MPDLTVTHIVNSLLSFEDIMAAFWTLAVAALEAIVQVVLIILSGFLLARTGYLDPGKQKWLSKLNMTFFTPCLLFTNIAKSISWDKFLALWPLPLFYFLFAGISWGLSRTGSRLFRFSGAQTRFVTATVIFSNTNSLPVAMIQSLALSKAGEILYWGADDTKEGVAARGISYILFFAVFGNILRWSYGYNLLSNDSESNSSDGDSRSVSKRKHQDALFDIESSQPSSGLHNYATIHASNPRRASLKPETHDHPYSDYASDSGSDFYDPPPLQTPLPADERSALLAFPRFPHDSDESENSWLSNPYLAPLVPIAKHIHAQTTPPLYAAFVALVFGLIPPLKHLLFDPSSFLYPSLTASIAACGSAAVPLVLVCLGAQLDDFSVSVWHQHTSAPVAFAVVARMLLTPFYVIPLVITFAAVAQGVSAVASDPVLVLVLIMLGCGPTAINLVQICQVNGMFEEEIAHVLFWSYGVVAVPLISIVIMIALVVVQAMA
ncbi:auxin efflux carrier [Endogone sp. FLAS-F59071]|nr:auxin efflux carrier [Endogone sp. FLAS-F59071]|eukprot:RUS16244.1 auxin efflux carrier [Endogone sp. FLAS-F59071]